MSAHGILPEIGTLIIGGGIVGLSTAMFLAAEGVDVAIVDGNGAGASTTNAGSLHVQMQASFLRRRPEQARNIERSLHLYPEAIRFWQEIESNLGADLDLKITGGLMAAETPEQLKFLIDKAHLERKRGLSVEILDQYELRRVAPYLREDLAGAEYCALEGSIDPLLANAAIRESAIAYGAQILYGAPVLRLEEAGVGFVASTAGGDIRAGRVVLAAGTSTGELAAQLSLNVPCVSRVLHMNVTEPLTPIVAHLVQHAELVITLKQLGRGPVVIGGGWPAHLSGHRNYAQVELASILGNASLAASLVPGIAHGRIVRTWAGSTTTADGACVLGASESSPGLFLALPGFAGFTLGPYIARGVADLLLGRSPTLDVSPFRPERFASD